MKKKLIAGAAAAALTASVGAGMFQTAQADTDAPTPTPSASASVSPGNKDMNRYERRGHAQRNDASHVAELADKLGESEDAVAEALETVRENATATRPATRPASPTERDSFREARQAEMSEALAAELGIDEDKVSAALDELRSDRDAMRSANRQANLGEAVTDGTLTQDEADAVQKAVDAGVMSPRGGHGHGRR